MNHQVLEDYAKHLIKNKSLNKKLNTLGQMTGANNDYRVHLLKSAAIVGLNVVFMKSMFKVFNMDLSDTGDVITLIETASSIITVYKIFQKLS